MQLPRDKMMGALRRKGFVERQTPHHDYFHHQLDGRDTGISTYFSRGSKYKDYGPALIAPVRRALKLDTDAQLRELIECPMSADDYATILRKKGFI
jgi:hypothetical protein